MKHDILYSHIILTIVSFFMTNAIFQSDLSKSEKYAFQAFLVLICLSLSYVILFGIPKQK